MDYISCSGSEGKLWGGCTHFTHYYGCIHDDDIGIQCKPGILIRTCIMTKLVLKLGFNMRYPNNNDRES